MRLDGGCDIRDHISYAQGKAQVGGGRFLFCKNGADNVVRLEEDVADCGMWWSCI